MENKFIPVTLFAKYLKVSDADADELFVLYLNAAQEVVENYIGYKLERATYQEAVRMHADGSMLALKAANITDLSIDTSPAEIAAQRVNIVIVKRELKKGEVLQVTYKAGFEADTIPAVIRLTIMRIAALMASEEGGDIAVTGKTFGNEGGRTFIATRDYSRLLREVDAYRIL